jgi:hypothetical protein
VELYNYIIYLRMEKMKKMKKLVNENEKVKGMKSKISKHLPKVLKVKKGTIIVMSVSI